MNLPLFFISDIHLRLTNSDGETKKRKQLIEFMDHVAEQQGTLFIVGDLFEFWFEYKYVMAKAYFDVLTALYRARLNGVDIYFIPGNHDFWTGEFAEDILFTKVYPKGHIFEVNGKKLLIIHGDGLLSRDKGYRVLRGLFRNRLFVALYRILHPDLGYTFARWISKAGNHTPHSDEYNQAVVTELKEVARNHNNQGIDYIVMGHYHQAKKVSLGDGSLVILGDWISLNSFGYFDGDEFSLNYWR